MLCLLITLSDYVDLGLGIPTWNEIFAGLAQELDPDGDYSQPGLAPEGTLEIHVIDVGQGESIFVRTQEKTVLIDAGENNKGEVVERYLKSQGVTSLDLVIGTHPHSDHIGGMDYVVDHFPVKRIIMPPLKESQVPTTKTYTDLLQSIANAGLEITLSHPGDEYSLGGGAVLKILGPVGEFSDLNNLSVVSKITFGEHAFLFNGDSSKEAEAALLTQKGLDPSADVLFVGHHGSYTSTSQPYLDAVDPSYASISVGADNDYGHPHQETIQKLEKLGIPYYRTDLCGNIVFISDGSSISVSTQKGGQAA